MTAPNPNPPCNRCGSANVGTGGTCPTSGKQRYKCRDCSRLFVEHNRHIPSIEEIQLAIERDKTIAQIAEFYDITDSAIYVKLKQHNIPAPQRPKPSKWDDRIETVRAMIADDVPLQTIADQYGICRSRLRLILSQYGIQANRGS